MHHLETQPLASFNDTPVDKPASFVVEMADGSHLAYETAIENTPFVTSTFDGRHNSQMMLSNQAESDRWDEAELFPVGRLAGFHGRNLEVLAERVSIEDQFGNRYHSLGIKGSDLSNPHFFKHPTAERDFIIHGLQESLVVERVLRASRFLRENGVSTEYICGLALPNGFSCQRGIDRKQTLKLPEFLEYLSTEFAKENNGQDGKSVLEIKASMIERFRDCDYLVSYRAMDCPYRFGEISDAAKFGEFMAFLKRNNPDAADFREHYTSFEDAREEIFPLLYTLVEFVPRLAQNVGKMHSLGIAHHFLHAHNITALGSVVDLDSCKGEPLGIDDESITEADILDDITTCIDSLEKTIDSMDFGHTTHQEFRDFATHLAISKFLDCYIKERFTASDERNALLATMLLRESQKPEHTQDIYQLSAYVADTYSRFHTTPNATPSIEALSTCTIGVCQQDSSVRILPAKFFRDLRSSALKLPEAHQSRPNQSDATDEEPFYPPTKFLIDDTYALQLIKLYTQDEKIQRSDELLFAMAHVLECIPAHAKGSYNQAELSKAREHARIFKERILDKLCEVSEETIYPQFQDRFTDFQGDIKLQVGQTGAVGEEETGCVLYLENETQYKQTFNALGINENVRIDLKDQSTLIAIFEEMRADPDSIIIADYATTEWVARAQSSAEAFRALFHRPPSSRPLLAIREISSDNPAVDVYCRLDEQSEYLPSPYTLKEVLGLEGPPPIGQRLF